MYKYLCVVSFSVISLGTDSLVAESPFNDAVALWDMEKWDMEKTVPSGTAPSLEAFGNVKLGVALSGAAREESLRRGGNGLVAEFQGGFLRAGSGATPSLELKGKAMTLCLRIRDPDGRWNKSLLAHDDRDNPFGRILYGTGAQLEYLWRTSPLRDRVIAGWDPLGPARHGFNGEGNDAHNLIIYDPGKLGVSILAVDESGLISLSYQGNRTVGWIQAEQQNLGDALFRVGAKHAGGEWLEGDIAEILVYDRVLTESETDSLEANLAAKWGIKLDIERSLSSPNEGASSSGPPESGLPTSGLAMHLDANDLNLPSGHKVGAWDDRSGRGRNVSQDNMAHQPVLISSERGGKPVVRFGGHHWLDGPPILDAGDSTFTFVAVWKRNHDDGSQVIIEQSAPGQGRRAALLAVGKRKLNTEFAKGILRLGVPTKTIRPTDWHDVVVRFRGPNLELFVDGVLVDEEWPHGALYDFRTPLLIGAGYESGTLKTGFQGLVDHVALWDRALRDEEIVAICGGAREVARRDVEILGKQQASMQYWKPRGYNAFAGDCMPFYHDGTFHLFYLFDRRHHGSKWGQGAHQYAHATSRDLIHWEHHPLAVPIAKQWECSMGTCDTIWHDGLFHVFYTDCGNRCEYKDKPRKDTWIFVATSRDGIHFHKDFKHLVPGRDCEVLRDPETGLFHLVLGGGKSYVSSDLRNWDESPDEFVRRKPGTSAECPNHLEWNGWHYFLVGRNAVWKSRRAVGDWTELAPNIYDGLAVPKVAEFTGNRRLLAGFLEYPDWGGNIVFRELIQHEDGSLGTKFPAEMIPASGDPLSLPFAALSSGASADGSTIHVKADDNLVIGMLTGVPANVRITLRVKPQSGARYFGLCFRGEGKYENGCELRFEPDRQRVQFGTPQNGSMANESSPVTSEAHDFRIERFEDLDRPFSLDVIIKDNIIDVSIDQRRTMITRRRRQLPGDRLFFFARNGEVDFDHIAVRPLRD